MYHIDRRKLAVHIYSFYQSLRKTAKLLMVGHSTIARWLKNPDRKRYQRSCNKPLKSQIIVQTIKTAIEANPFISIQDLRILVYNCTHVEVSKELIRIAIRRIGMTKKKARYYGVSKQQSERTNEFLQKRNKYLQESRKFVSIDETSFGRNGINIFGYAPIGKKLHLRKSPQRVITTSVVCCVSKDGIVGKCQKSGAFNTESFRTFIENLELPLNAVVLLDNVGFHRTKVVQSVFAEKNVDVLFVPPYSPWFNPIEMCFSIVKRSYYKHLLIDRAFQELTSSHCKAFFAKSLGCIGPF